MSANTYAPPCASRLPAAMMSHQKTALSANVRTRNLVSSARPPRGRDSIEPPLTNPSSRPNRYWPNRRSVKRAFESPSRNATISAAGASGGTSMLPALNS
jgi:hypothetical protein